MFSADLSIWSTILTTYFFSLILTVPINGIPSIQSPRLDSHLISPPTIIHIQALKCLFSPDVSYIHFLLPVLSVILIIAEQLCSWTSLGAVYLWEPLIHPPLCNQCCLLLNSTALMTTLTEWSAYEIKTKYPSRALKIFYYLPLRLLFKLISYYINFLLCTFINTYCIIWRDSCLCICCNKFGL